MAGKLTQRSEKSFSLLLAGKPLNNAGARKALAMRRQQRAVPFTPINVFGFVLDEQGPERMAAPIEWTGAAAKRGGV
jgi:hypothetical protein